MAFGVNAWGVDNPVLNNFNKILLSTKEVSSGDTSVEFDLSYPVSVYKSFIIEGDALIASAAIAQLQAVFGIGGGYYTAASYNWTPLSNLPVLNDTSIGIPVDILTSPVEASRLIIEVFQVSFSYSSSPSLEYRSYKGDNLLILGGGRLAVLGAVTALKLTASAGAFQSGKFSCFGLPSTT